jgi:hypothetical protein
MDRHSFKNHPTDDGYFDDCRLKPYELELGVAFNIHDGPLAAADRSI